jgi:plasmid maintenance system killer protein
LLDVTKQKVYAWQCVGEGANPSLPIISINLKNQKVKTVLSKSDLAISSNSDEWENIEISGKNFIVYGNKKFAIIDTNNNDKKTIFKASDEFVKINSEESSIYSLSWNKKYNKIIVGYSGGIAVVDIKNKNHDYFVSNDSSYVNNVYFDNKFVFFASIEPLRLNQVDLTQNKTNNNMLTITDIQKKLKVDNLSNFELTELVK